MGKKQKPAEEEEAAVSFVVEAEVRPPNKAEKKPLGREESE